MMVIWLRLGYIRTGCKRFWGEGETKNDPSINRSNYLATTHLRAGEVGELGDVVTDVATYLKGKMVEGGGLVLHDDNDWVGQTHKFPFHTEQFTKIQHI